jgi:hypothetical protein
MNNWLHILIYEDESEISHCSCVYTLRATPNLVLSGMQGLQQLVGGLLYGSSLCLMECLYLRVKEIDFEQSQEAVREGKSDKDRFTLLLASLL